MNSINQHFQAILNEQEFPLKMTQEAERMLYEGKIALSKLHKIHFAISISYDDSFCIGQILFNDIMTIPSEVERFDLLESINHLNTQYGYYYYFGITDDNKIFARHVARLASDIDLFFDTLMQGGKIIRHALRVLMGDV